MPHWTESVRRLQQLKSELPVIVGNEMVNYALDNIRAESFDGRKWKPRSAHAPRNKGRKLLVDTGIGRRSIKVVKATLDVVQLSANDYMQAHNEGAHITGSRHVRAHTRVRRGRAEAVRSFTRKVDYQLPERRFTGKSPKQTARINKILANRIVQALT